MTKKIKNLSQLKSSKFSPLSLAMFAAALAVAGYIIIFSKAAPAPPTIYLNPASAVIGPNGTVTLEVRENSATTSVNAIQANFSYPSSQLTITGFDYTGSAFGIKASELPYGTGTISQTGTAITGTGTTFAAFMGGKTLTYNDGTTATVQFVDSTHLTSSVSKTVTAGSTYTIGKGSAELGVGTTTAVTGDQLIAKVTFQANTTGGAANLAFVTGTSLVRAVSPNDNLITNLSQTGGATVTVDTAGPTTTVTAPANNANIALGSTPTISATATDAASTVTKVEIYIDGALKTTLTTSPYNYVWNTGVTAGAHTIQAKGYDTFNNVGNSSLVNVNVTDQTAPSAAVTAPANGSFLSGTAVNVTANASDNVAVVGVQFKLDGANLGAEDTTAPYATTWNTTTATNGVHSLTAVARDAAGNNTTSSTVSVTVDNAIPTVSISSPTNGSTVNGIVPVNVTATDNSGGSGISKVELYVDGVLNNTDTSSPYSFSWDTSALTFGSTHTLSAKAYDNVSTPNVATSSNVSVTINDTTPPTMPGNFRATTVLPTSVSLAWNASTDNVAVTGYQVRRGGTLLTTTTSLTYTDSGLTPSTAYSYTVTAVDAAGNSSPTAGAVNVTTLSLKQGDINRDNAVDLLDLSFLISSYGSSTDPCITNTSFTCGLITPAGVDVFDLSVLLSNYGT